MNSYFMSELLQMIDSLEIKISKLIEKNTLLEQTTIDLKNKCDNYQRVIQNQSNDYVVLSERYNALKIAHSLAGSDDFKRETKLKINSIIREIDTCLMQLAD